MQATGFIFGGDYKLGKQKSQVSQKGLSIIMQANGVIFGGHCKLSKQKSQHELWRQTTFDLAETVSFRLTSKAKQVKKATRLMETEVTYFGGDHKCPIFKVS